MISVEFSRLIRCFDELFLEERNNHPEHEFWRAFDWPIAMSLLSREQRESVAREIEALIASENDSERLVALWKQGGAQVGIYPERISEWLTTLAKRLRAFQASDFR